MLIGGFSHLLPSLPPSLPPSLLQELVRATNRYLEAPSPASLLVRYVFPPSLLSSLPLCSPFLLPFLPPHRVRLIEPVISTPISPYFPTTQKSDPSLLPSLPPSLRSVAEYATWVFKCLGLASGSEGELGFSSSLGAGGQEGGREGGREEELAPVLDVVASFRDALRAAAIEKDPR
jgi:hypothetical protein